MAILEKIRCSADVKKLPAEEIEPLCSEIRRFLVEHLSKTGGHLASNLGIVELSVALHRVYDTATDRLVFDVGHQCYTHKLVTGRREGFDRLRQYGGISGFPKPYEAVDDAFIAGHASNSVSVALGMAKARTLKKENYDVVALIGDGALTGGLSYEGLTGAAASGEQMVVVLNDNSMSIDRNVGGMANMLQHMRIRPGYISFKRWYRDAIRNLPGFYRFTHRVKEWLKSRLLPENVFSAMGWEYIGPVDGHDENTLETVRRWAKDEQKPVLVHILTQKGKGCDFAEARPELYHGVGPFDPETGELKPSGPCFSERFGQKLCGLAVKEPGIVAVTAAMASGTGLDQFAERFPDRFVDAGIAEGHATAMVAGMAKQGLIPVFAVYSSFLQRGYDMLIHDVALQGLHAVFCVDRAGLVGSDGETHHGIFDVDYLRSVPGMTIFCPASFAELDKMLDQAIFHTAGPVAIRYPRGGEGRYQDCADGDELVVKPGRDLTILCYGTMVNEVMEAAERLEEKGISPEIIKVNRIGDQPYQQTLRSLSKTGRFLAVEEACHAGCLGETILALAVERRIPVRGGRLLNLGDGIVAHGSREELMRDHGIDAAAIIRAAGELCGK